MRIVKCVNSRYAEEIVQWDNAFFSDSVDWINSLDDDTLFWVIVDQLTENNPQLVVVAYAALKFVDGGKTGYLNRCAVMPEYRGRGLQRRLIKHRIKYAKAHSIKRLVTFTHYKNYASANNIIKCGFLLFEPDFDTAPEYLYFRRVLK